jgi:hypothetical protein
LERKLAISALVLGLLVAALLAQKGANFLPNLGFFWLSQIIALSLCLPFRPRPAVIAGAAFALATYLAGFALWVATHPNSAGPVWFGYLFSLPGAAVGAIAAALLLRDRFRYGVAIAILSTAGLALLGLLLNQTMICMTVMYCLR